jgi:c-di-GMP-binding flagellar brake protein YcgR
MAEMSTSSRQGHRYYFDGRVNITVYRPGGKLDFWGRISDLSESGMGATVSGELSQGEFVVLQFSVSSSSPSLELRARVCHQRGYHCGFEFLIVSDRQREDIKLACEGLPIKHSQEKHRDL